MATTRDKRGSLLDFNRGDDWVSPAEIRMRQEEEERLRREDEERLNSRGSPSVRGRYVAPEPVVEEDESSIRRGLDRFQGDVIDAAQGGIQSTVGGQLGLTQSFGQEQQEFSAGDIVGPLGWMSKLGNNAVNSLREASPWYKETFDKGAATISGWGSDLMDAADANARAVQAGEGERDWLDQGIVDLFQSPSSALSVIGGPAAAIGAADVRGQEYTRARREGLTHDAALNHANLMAGVELGTSVLPTGKLFTAIPAVKKSINDVVQGTASKWIKRTANQMAGESLQETVTTLTQMGVNKVESEFGETEETREYAEQQLPKDTVDFFNQVRRSAVAGALGGGSLGQIETHQSIIADAGKLASDMYLADAKYKGEARDPALLEKQLSNAITPDNTGLQGDLFPETLPGPFTPLPEAATTEPVVPATRIPKQGTLKLNRPYQPVAGRKAAEAQREAAPVVVQPIVQAKQAKTKKVTDEQRSTYQTLYPELKTDEDIAAFIAQESKPASGVDALKKRVGLPMKTDAAKAGVTPEQVVDHIAKNLGSEKTNALAKLIGDGKVVLDNADTIPVDGAAGYDPKTGRVHINTSALDPKNILGGILEQAAGHELDHAARTSANPDIKRSLGDLFSEPATKKLVSDVNKMAASKNPAEKKWAENVLQLAKDGSTPETYDREVAGYAVSEALKGRQKGATAVISRTGVSALRTWAKRVIPGLENDLNVKDLAYLSDKVVSAAARTDKTLAGKTAEAPLAMINGEQHPDYAKAEREGLAFRDPADGKMKFITSDVNAALQLNKTDHMLLGAGQPMKMPSVFKYEELYNAYPKTAEAELRFDKNMTPDGASYNETSNVITIGSNVLDGMLAGKAASKAILLHELQHGIQGIEDFARGGDMDQFYSDEDVKNIASAKYYEDQVNKQADKLEEIYPMIPYENSRGRIRRALNQRRDTGLTNAEAFEVFVEELEGKTGLPSEVADWLITTEIVLENVKRVAPLRTKAEEAARTKYESLRGEQEARFVQKNADKELKDLPLNPLDDPEYAGETRVSKKIGDVKSGTTNGYINSATKTVTLKDGTEVDLLLEDEAARHTYSTPGGGITVEAYDADGNYLGGASFTTAEEADGLRYNPLVEIERDSRRKGLATEIYKFAEENGAKIPKLSQRGQVRTEEGQAFRTSEAMKPLAMKLSDVTERMENPDVNTKLGKAMQVVRAQLLYHSGLGKELFERLKLSTGEASRDAQRGLNAGANIEAGIKKLAADEGKTVDEVRTMVEARMDALTKLPTPEARERALASMVRQYPALRSLSKAYSDIDQMTKELVKQMLINNPDPTKKDWKFYEELLNNSFGYTTRMYAAYQGQAGTAYSQKLMADYNKALKKTNKGKKLSPAQESAMARVDAAVNYIAKHDLTIPPADKISKVSLENIKYLYDMWIGDADYAYQKAKEAAEAAKMEESGWATAAQDKLIEDLLAFAPSVDTESLQAKAKEAVDTMLGLGDNAGAVPKYLRTASADRGILQKREELPDEIRALLGEIKDPGTRVQATIAKQGELIARTKFLMYMKQHGEGKWVVSPQTTADGKFTSTLDGDGFGPLKGWKTTPQIAGVIKDQLGMFSSTADAFAQGFAGADAQQAAWWRSVDDIVKKGAGAAKVASVIMEGFGTVMNSIGSFAVFVANGAPVETFYTGARGSMELIKNEFVGNKGSLSEEVLDAVAHGITDSAKINELKQQAQDQVRQSITGGGPVSVAGKYFNVAKRTGIEIFAQSDVWPKLAAYKHRKNVLRKYYDAIGQDMSDEDIAAEAATQVKDTNISSDRVPPALKTIEARGITRFMPYFYNVPRSLTMSAGHGAADLLRAMKAPTPEGRLILGMEGIRRLTGTGMATYGLMLATKGIAAAINGDDEEKVEEIKKVLNPEARYGDVIYLGKDDTGAPLFFRLGRIDPNGPVTDLARMLLDPTTEPEEMTAMTLRYVKDIAFANTYTKIVLDAMSDTVGDGKMKDKVVRLERIMPRATSYLKDAIRAFEVKDSLAEASVGLIDTQLPGQIDMFDPNNKRVMDAKSDSSQITGDLVKYSGGRLDRADPALRAFVLGKELKERRDAARKLGKEYMAADRSAAAMREARRADKDIYHTMMQLHDVYDGMVNGLDMSPRAAQAALKDAGLTSTDVGMIVRGRTPTDLEDVKPGKISRIFSDSSTEMRNKTGDKMLSAEDRAAALAKRKAYLESLTNGGAERTN